MKKNYNVADDEWEWYIGQLYYQLIKNLYSKDINCVVELAPGFRYKIAVALSQLNFSGTIYVIDSSKDVINYIQQKYEELLPNANIICINDKFENAIDQLPDNIDLFLSNHSIDDLIISNYSKNQYNEESNNELLFDELLKMWEELYKDKDTVKKITSKVVDYFTTLFDKKNIEMIIMGQYKSNLYYLGKSSHMDEIVEDCFKKIKQLTNTNDELVNKLLDYYPFGRNDERYNGKYLIDNTQTAINWIAGNIK